MFHRFISWWQGADSSLAVHRWLLWVWIVLAFPSVLLWKDSVPWLVVLSVYAIIVGHWSAVQAAKVEKQEEDR